MSEHSELGPAIVHLQDEIKNNNGVSLEYAWNSMFNTVEPVSIDVAQEAFAKLLNTYVSDEKVAALLKWLSRDGKTVSIDNLKLLWDQLKRDKYKLLPGDFTFTGYKVGIEPLCDSFLGKSGLKCVTEIIYEVSTTPGFFNKTDTTEEEKLMKKCEYLFRKSSNSQYLFTFVYKDDRGNLKKVGIFISSKGTLMTSDGFDYADFNALKSAILKRPCNSSVKYYSPSV